jgi:hypothetical protein
VFSASHRHWMTVGNVFSAGHMHWMTIGNDSATVGNVFCASQGDFLISTRSFLHPLRAQGQVRDEGITLTDAYGRETCPSHPNFP